MNLQNAENIIVKYFSRSASARELEQLAMWLNKEENKTHFKDYVKLNYYIDYNVLDFELIQEKKKILRRAKVKRTGISGIRYSSIYKYAAVLVVFLAIGYYFLTSKNLVDDIPIIVNNDIKTGTDKATLTLDDGTDIILEKGQFYTDNNLTSDGESLVYKALAKMNPAYNYLTIPRGGQYLLKLSDGTQVWLNSESKLKYPVSFLDGQARQVELIYGEAYFDVSPSTEHKGAAFRVINASQNVEVLGTEFNIKAYSDEANIYTILVEGKIAVSNANVNQILKPGEQFNLNISNRETSVNQVDVYRETSWRKGIFSFRHKPLKEIMKVLSRWYDMDVIFLNKALENEKFIGTLSKDQDIEIILSAIKNTNIINTYEINNKTVIIR